MDRVLIESTIRSRLHGLDAEMEFCDESGRTLGYFIPRSGLDRDYQWAEGAFSDAEIQRARDESGGRTTRDVLARLDAECTSPSSGNLAVVFEVNEEDRMVAILGVRRLPRH